MATLCVSGKSSVVKADKELKAFSKVYLQAGQEKEVVLTLNTADMAYYDEASRNWVVKTGNYNLMIGNSSRNIQKIVSVVLS